MKTTLTIITLLLFSCNQEGEYLTIKEFQEYRQLQETRYKNLIDTAIWAGRQIPIGEAFEIEDNTKDIVFIKKHLNLWEDAGLLIEDSVKFKGQRYD